MSNRKYRIRRWSLIATTLVVSCGGSALQAQDPFGGGGNTAREVPPIPAPRAAAETGGQEGGLTDLETLPKGDSRRVLLSALRSSNPSTAKELCAAIRTTLDIRVNDDAREYLKRLIDLNLAPPEMSDLMASEGSAFFLRISTDPETSAIGRPYVRKMFDAVSAYDSSPEQLDLAIDRLHDSSLELRSEAFRRLRRIGAPAVVRLINRFATETDRERVFRYRSALRSMGEESLLPLIGAGHAGNLQVRYEAFTALARIRNRDALYAAVGAVNHPGEVSALREGVLEGIRQTWGEGFSIADASERSYERAVELLTGQSLLTPVTGSSDDLSQMPYWIWDDTANELVEQTFSPATVARLIALDRTRDLARSTPDNQDFRQLHLLAWLDSAKRVVGPMTLVTPESAAEEFANLSVSEIDGIARAAVRMDLFPAAAAACDLLGQMPNGGDTLFGPREAGLIVGLKSGDHYTQFAATRAIDAIDSASDFPGSSYYLESLVRMATAEEQGVVLVAHPDIQVARNISVSLAASGFVGRAFSSGRDLFAHASQDSAVQFLMISEQTGIPDSATLIQQLRLDWRTRRLPIVVMRKDDDQIPLAYLKRDPLTIDFPMTDDRPLVNVQLKRLMETQGEWLIDAPDTAAQADWATDVLVKVASDRQRYRHLDLAAHRDRLIALMNHEWKVERVMPIMVALGTADSQRALLDLASRSGEEPAVRSAALEAFVASMERSGLLLKSDEILRQYNRYDAATNESLESRQILGSILGAIEKRAATTAGSGGGNQD